jgi:hypothetical protein
MKFVITAWWSLKMSSSCCARPRSPLVWKVSATFVDEAGPVATNAAGPGPPAGAVVEAGADDDDGCVVDRFVVVVLVVDELAEPCRAVVVGCADDVDDVGTAVVPAPPGSVGPVVPTGAPPGVDVVVGSVELIASVDAVQATAPDASAPARNALRETCIS